MGWLEDLDKKTKPADVKEAEDRLRKEEEDKKVSALVREKFTQLCHDLHTMKSILVKNRVKADLSFRMEMYDTLTVGGKSLIILADPDDKRFVFRISDTPPISVVWNRERGFFSYEKDRDTMVNFDDLIKNIIEKNLLKP